MSGSIIRENLLNGLTLLNTHRDKEIYVEVVENMARTIRCIRLI